MSKQPQEPLISGWPENPRERTAYVTGVLDSCARIQRAAITVSTPHREILERLRDHFGGWIDGNRLVIRSPSKRLDLLREWKLGTRGRRHEIAEAQVALLDTGSGEGWVIKNGYDA